MIALYLLASHLVGDFVFQTRWQAAGKFGWTDEAVMLRVRHVAAYQLAFVPVAVAYGGWNAIPFLWFLGVLHFLTDSRRSVSTLGDVLVWTWRSVRDPQRVFLSPEPLPPNPWGPLPILIDQTLHIVQLAALGWLLT